MDRELYKKALEVFKRDLRYSISINHKIRRESKEFIDLIIMLVESIIVNNPEDVLRKSVKNFLKTSCFLRNDIIHRKEVYKVIRKSFTCT